MVEAQLLESAMAASNGRESTPLRHSPKHVANKPEVAARLAQIGLMKIYAMEMDNYVDEHRTAASSILCDHWDLFKSIMPEEVDDWFAQLETTASLRQRIEDLESYESVGDFNVLETTEEAFCQLWESNDSILSHVGMVVFRKAMTNPEQSAGMIEETLRVAYADAEAEVQNYSDHGGTIFERMGVVMQDFRERADGHALKTLQERPPRNILSIASEIVADIHSPQIIKMLDCILLPILCQRLRAEVRASYEIATAGKKTVESDWLVDLESCLRFGLMAERGALTLAHLDILNGTWVTCLSGAKFWCAYQGKFGSDERAEFAEQGMLWKPKKASVKGVYLEPGDTLLMLPGVPVVHWVLTIDDCMMAGGMFWSHDRITAIMRNLQYTMGNAAVTNEHIPRQFPAILDVLIRLADDQRLLGSRFSSEQTEAMQSLKRCLKPIISCSCERGCSKKNCPCLSLTEEAEVFRKEGCITWCHHNIRQYRDPSQACAERRCARQRKRRRTGR